MTDSSGPGTGLRPETREALARYSCTREDVGINIGLGQGISAQDAVRIADDFNAVEAAIYAERAEARREALEEAAKIAERTYPRGGAHTYASENAERYVALEDACESVASRLRRLASRGGATVSPKPNPLNPEPQP